MRNQGNQPNRRREQQPAGFSCWTMVLIFLGIQFITQLFVQKPNNTRTTPTQGVQRSSANFIANVMPRQAALDLEIDIISGNKVLYQNKTEVIYSLNFPQIDMQVELTDLEDLTENITIHARFSSKNGRISPIQFQNTANLTAWKKIKNEAKSLFDSNNAIQKKQQNKYATQIPNDFNIFLVYSQLAFEHAGQIPPQLQFKLVSDEDFTYYLPIIDMSQMHIGTKHYRIPKASQKINLHFFCYSEYRYIMFYSLSHKVKMPSQMQNMLMDELLYNESNMDDVKQMLFQNNIYLVGLTIILSILQSIFQFLAVKNQIHVWRNIQKYQGLSLKVLYTSLFFSIIFTLYLIDNDASRMLIVFQIVDMFVTIWKIYKTSQIVRIQQFPYFKLTHPDWYKKTQVFDNQAIHYFYYILIPLFICYLIYSAFYSVYKGWYSFILQTIVGFIYIFGFVQMTPQLFINYKLKSVAHLPWRTLIYRFLNTIIDDLFAFLVTMPWLKRLACFRDDIIFVIYIYQRKIYQVDYTRVAMASSGQDTYDADKIKKD